MEESTGIAFVRFLDGTVALQRIAWWRPSSRFVVIQYTTNGHIEKYGKRLDLDKAAFLDSFDNPDLDAKLDKLIPEILEAVAVHRVDTERSEKAFASSGLSA